MTQRTPWIVAGLAVVIAVLVVSVTAFVAMNGDDDDHMGRIDNDYMGMMGAMGRMDSDDMLERMRSILGEQDYQQMLAHMAAHRAGGAMRDDAGIDGMMHRMMDGMMQQMPADSDHIMPGGR